MAFEKKQTGEDAKGWKDDVDPDEKKEAEGEERKHGGRHGKRAAGGAVARKHGGHVPGHKSEHRPDRRARGGGVGADTHPMSSAGNMSEVDYERGSTPRRDESSGKGADRNAKGFG